MEEVLLRFPYVGEEIFDLLDEKSLEKCKKVCKTWKFFIEDQNRKFTWIQNTKAHEEKIFLRSYKSRNYTFKIIIDGPKPQWSKLQIHELREFVKRLNSEKDE